MERSTTWGRRIAAPGGGKQNKRQLFSQLPFVLRWMFKIDIFELQKAPGEPSHRPSGRRRECAVQAFSPQVKTLAQGRLRRPEHSNTEGWRPPSAARRHYNLNIFKFSASGQNYTHPAFWPAARVRRTSVLPQAKPRRRGGSAAPSIEIPKGGAALRAAEPKTKGHPFGCPFVLVREAGVEPARPCEHWHLKPASLPIPPLAQR